MQLKETRCECGHYIVFIRMDTGTTMPCEAGARNFVVLDENGIGKTVRGYEPHWGNCKFASKFKKGRRR